MRLRATSHSTHRMVWTNQSNIAYHGPGTAALHSVRWFALIVDQRGHVSIQGKASIRACQDAYRNAYLPTEDTIAHIEDSNS
jgi:hypothetical protein